MFFIYVKKNKKIKDEDVVLIIVKETGKNRKYEIMTKDMKKFNVKKKSRKDVKNMTNRVTKKTDYFLKVKEDVWINTCFYKQEKATVEKNTFLMDKIRKHEEVRKHQKELRKQEKNIFHCYVAKCPCCNCPDNVKTKWAQRYDINNDINNDINDDDEDDIFYKKSK